MYYDRLKQQETEYKEQAKKPALEETASSIRLSKKEEEEALKYRDDIKALTAFFWILESVDVPKDLKLY